MTKPNRRHHEINYIEFPVTDMERAKQFYSEAFGWQFTDYAPHYVGIRRGNGEGECGGLCLTDVVSTGGPLVILLSDDLDDSYQMVKAAKGTITVETFSFPGGRRFQFRDPSGNELAVWTPSTTNG
jgi:uncharacterized protein